MVDGFVLLVGERTMLGRVCRFYRKVLFSVHSRDLLLRMEDGGIKSLQDARFGYLTECLI